MQAVQSLSDDPDALALWILLQSHVSITPRVCCRDLSQPCCLQRSLHQEGPTIFGAGNMPSRDPPQNPSISVAKRASSIGQLSQASSFEEVRFEDLDRSDSEEDRPQAAPATEQGSTSKVEPSSQASGIPPVPTTKPAQMHMVDSENDLVQPASKKDITLRELHDPIEGDSAGISWRGNSEMKAKAREPRPSHSVKS